MSQMSTKFNCLLGYSDCFFIYIIHVQNRTFERAMKVFKLICDIKGIEKHCILAYLQNH